MQSSAGVAHRDDIIWDERLQDVDQRRQRDPIQGAMNGLNRRSAVKNSSMELFFGSFPVFHISQN